MGYSKSLCFPMLGLALLMVYASADSDCMSVIMPLAPCLPFVTGATPSPPITCCSAFGIVANSKPMCLCTVLAGDGSQYGVRIDKALSLSLPATCNVDTPPPDHCFS
ncbi:hypothetical protein ZOSMA_9G00580 [Zostera marina]|uniref:Bifunctional inhibitor/plant lipid transfer protein/seed storage helical domain-containing protein n=1 Tax=Zostera marina TaxID=29655 RepID=A0A0K9NIZ8_ZOSMR|nr:hypothetical protein ZOSMA_9G00580 [Zostera marina]